MEIHEKLLDELTPYKNNPRNNAKAVDAVETLMAGAKADMLLTDPPYGVDYEGVAGKIQNDNLQGEKFKEFLRSAFYAAKCNMVDGGGVPCMERVWPQFFYIFCGTT